MHANYQTCMMIYSEDAVQTDCNSTSDWNQTSFSYLCSYAPLHHTSFQQCHAILQIMQQTTHMRYKLSHM